MANYFHCAEENPSELIMKNQLTVANPQAYVHTLGPQEFTSTFAVVCITIHLI
jgi:hypothetical protein